MATFDSIKQRQPSDILYHYTTQEGLLGIITTGEIWCTKIHYLSDASEFSLALEMSREHLRQRLESTDSAEEGDKINFLLKQIDSIELINVCVCSFSEKGDLLSQWRAYCEERSGFSIGFGTEALKSIAKKADFFLAPCIYDPETQKELISDLIDSKLEKDFSIGGWKSHPNKPRTFVALPQDHEFALKLTTLAPIIKHESFSEEKEWRLISKAIPFQNLGFRHGLSMVTPYFRLNINTDGKFQVIKKVIVGPTPHIDLSLNSTRALLGSKDILQNIDVEVSTIPYRNW